jgi:hypothetical protein
LSGEIFKQSNKIEKFRAASNKLKRIDQKLTRRLKDAETFDLRGNICIDAVYDKTNTNFTMVTLHSQIYVGCATDDYD